MSAALMLPYVWAESVPLKTYTAPISMTPSGGIAFYRKRTERLLRRYMLVSLQTGRVPSLIGNYVFRGKASTYRMHNFEDAVIFLFDIEKCLKTIDPLGRELIARIALQEYTQEETAKLIGRSLRSVARKYADTLDALSRVFLDLDLLEID
jgi:DNA-directed RNA polymerase specialized sigma24 family protein